MKKYVKPSMEMEKIEMNQAIAACSTTDSSLTRVFIGYGNSWSGGANGKIYKSEEEARADGVTGGLCAVYELHRADGTRLVSLEDYGCDGTIDNIQNGEWNDKYKTVFSS